MKMIKMMVGLISIALISGCMQSMNKADAPVNMNSTVMVDLNVVSKATGQDDIINNNMKAVNADLTLQLGEIVTSFNKQLADEKKKFGEKITVEEQQKLQEMLIKANQSLAQKQTEANTKAQQHKQGLINAWREKIQPIIKLIADSKKAKVVLVQSPSIMWFDSTIDITDEVIAALRKNPIKNFKGSGKVDVPIGSGDVI